MITEFSEENLPKYPGLNSPCNGCGQCCLAKQCPPSLDFFGKHDRCPALSIKGDRYNCGLLSDTISYVLDADLKAIRRWIPPVGAEFPEVWEAHFRFIFGGGICDSEGLE
jgi:hypothetical protein